jgi:hypothetical protein
MGSLRRALRRADRGRAVARPYHEDQKKLAAGVAMAKTTPLTAQERVILFCTADRAAAPKRSTDASRSTPAGVRGRGRRDWLRYQQYQAPPLVRPSLRRVPKRGRADCTFHRAVLARTWLGARTDWRQMAAH